MLAAMVTDFVAAGVDVRTLLDGRLRDQLRPAWPEKIIRWINFGDEETAFLKEARAADFTMVIAPEFDCILETRCRWVLDEGGRLLGPAPGAVALAADKLSLSKRLLAAGVPTPITAPFTGQAPFPFPVVIKPRDGAGSQETYQIQSESQWPVGQGLPCRPTQVGRASPALRFDEVIVQPFVPGTPASIAFIIGPRQTIALQPAAQHLSTDGRFHYIGGEIPLPPPLSTRAERIARRAVDAVPGLLGYVGVDVVLGAAEDGGDDFVIEINPRLTTSYIGLRALADCNLAAMMLAVASGEMTPPPQWKPGSVRFRADGATLS